MWENIQRFAQKMSVHFLSFLFKWKGVKPIIKYVENGISNSTSSNSRKREREKDRDGGERHIERNRDRQRETEREEQKHNPTSKTSFLKLLKNVTSYTSY